MKQLSQNYEKEAQYHILRRDINVIKSKPNKINLTAFVLISFKIFEQYPPSFYSIFQV